MGDCVGSLTIMPDKIILHPAITHCHFSEIDSTNSHLMRSSSPCPQLISADTQTAGRGRRQQQWVDEGRSLLFSLATAFDTCTDVSAWSIQVAITLAAELQAFTKQRLLIKWPNDLYTTVAKGGYGKLAGILVESSIGKSGKMVTGVGINLSPLHSQITCDYPLAYLHTNADNSTLLNSLANALYRQWQEFLTTPTVDEQDFARYDMLFGKSLLATDSNTGKETVGQGHGINAKGQLLIQQHGDLQALTSLQRIRLI